MYLLHATSHIGGKSLFPMKFPMTILPKICGIVSYHLNQELFYFIPFEEQAVILHTLLIILPPDGLLAAATEPGIAPMGFVPACTKDIFFVLVLVGINLESFSALFYFSTREG